MSKTTVPGLSQVYFAMYTPEHVNKWANLTNLIRNPLPWLISTALGPWRRAGMCLFCWGFGPLWLLFAVLGRPWAAASAHPAAPLPSPPPQQGRKGGGKAHGWQQGGHLPITIISKTGKSIYCLLKHNWTDSTTIRLQVVGAPELYIHCLLIQVLFQEGGGQPLCREPRLVGHWLGAPAGMEVRVTLEPVVSCVLGHNTSIKIKVLLIWL